MTYTPCSILAFWNKMILSAFYFHLVNTWNGVQKDRFYVFFFIFLPGFRREYTAKKRRDGNEKVV